MPLDLKSITSPDKFRVIYYAILIYNESRILLDLTPWIDIPASIYLLKVDIPRLNLPFNTHSRTAGGHRSAATI
jgi:hypothetical protein